MRVRNSLLLAILLSVLVALPAAAQIRLNGFVRDDQTEQPIAGARVEIFGFDGLKLAQVATDETGAFAHQIRRPGTYRLRVSRIGFRSTVTAEFQTGAHYYMNVEVRLRSDAVLLAPLTVVARSQAYASPVLDGFHARLASGLGTFFTRADVEKIRPGQVSDLVARTPGMFIASSGSGFERHIYSGRNAGTRECPAQIWVDGFLLNPRGSTGLTLDEAVAPQNIEGIEIYRGLATVPAEFLNQEARCGVVAVWTRRGGTR